MEFRYNLAPLFKTNIIKVNHNLVPVGFNGDRRQLLDTTTKMTEIINVMGEASAHAQGLNKAVTNAQKLRNSDQFVYLLCENSGQNGCVTGLLKVGTKNLYVFDPNGETKQVNAPCVLDFYVHESRQRAGHGKKLFAAMLEEEHYDPSKLAIDRPSEKLIGFLQKHYGLNRTIPQMNNFVVYEGFFGDQSPQPVDQRNVNITSSPNTALFGPHVISDNKTGAAVRSMSNTQQQQQQQPLPAVHHQPMGRFGAPRPMCSMAETHNQHTNCWQRNAQNLGTIDENHSITSPQVQPASDQFNYAQNPSYQEHQQQQQQQQHYYHPSITNNTMMMPQSNQNVAELPCQNYGYNCQQQNYQNQMSPNIATSPSATVVQPTECQPCNSPNQTIAQNPNVTQETTPLTTVPQQMPNYNYAQMCRCVNCQSAMNYNHAAGGAVQQHNHPCTFVGHHNQTNAQNQQNIVDPQQQPPCAYSQFQTNSQTQQNMVEPLQPVTSATTSPSQCMLRNSSKNVFYPPPPPLNTPIPSQCVDNVAARPDDQSLYQQQQQFDQQSSSKVDISPRFNMQQTRNGLMPQQFRGRPVSRVPLQHTQSTERATNPNLNLNRPTNSAPNVELLDHVIVRQSDNMHRLNSAIQQKFYNQFYQEYEGGLYDRKSNGLDQGGRVRMQRNPAEPFIPQKPATPNMIANSPPIGQVNAEAYEKLPFTAGEGGVGANVVAAVEPGLNNVQ